jgi:hypothetical protein
MVRIRFKPQAKREILEELKGHAPFTLLGAFTGAVFVYLFYKMPAGTAFRIFYVLHPTHVVLSALVTASMYELHEKGPGRRPSLFKLLVIGYIGSIGIATLSDSIIPYLGEVLLSLPNREIHIGFIEKWWLVNPLAFLGIAIAYFRPATKFPHAGHVLLSTWASLFHIIMALGEGMTLSLLFFILVFLFLSVWVPCCFSDIVFPLLFVKEKTG